SDLEKGDVVELQYSVSQTSSTNMFGDYFGELWYAQSDAPTVAARYVLLLPDSREVDIRQPRMPHKATTTTVDTDEGPLEARIWTFAPLAGLVDEPSSPGLSELSDYIHVSTWQSWQELSAWYWNLIEDQLVVDSEIKKAVAKTVEGITDRR